MASLSKREQARNERELQDLLRQPGNAQCADCGTRNPAWASWNIGIFLCMRCASIHRKLGTHISKVKSLSMDKWTTDQVEHMKQLGNLTSNKHYNPKNKSPDIPLDADEVDSAMERFIRKKYQEKSLVDGRPEPPSRAAVSPSTAHPPQPSPQPELPTPGKKHKFFGFSLRTSSKKDRLGVDNAFKITPVEYSPTSGHTREVPDRELQEKLAQLNDMGFPENEKNLDILKRCGGDLERTIAMLVKLGPSDSTPKPPPRVTASRIPPASTSVPPATTLSNNPFDQLDQRDAREASSFGLSFDTPQQQVHAHAPPQPPSANPWQSSMPAQQSTGIEHQFSSMQRSNPLFPHHTGGYGIPSNYQDPRLQSMTPPVPTLPLQYGYTASPSSNASNPFYQQQQQQPMSSQSTGNNPYLQHQQSQPVFAPSPSTNPFLGMQPTSTSNPFGLLPQVSNQQYVQSPQPQPQPQNTNPFDIPAQASLPQHQQFQQQNSFAQHQAQSQQPQLSNLQYGLAQQQPLSAYHQMQGQAHPQAASYTNQQLQPQQTGRYTKNDIMALFNTPAPPHQQGLAPVQEAHDAAPQQQPSMSQQPISPAPSNNPYGTLSPSAGKRAATMPVTSMSNMHSSSGAGSTTRNPFMNMSTQSSNVTLSSASAPFGHPPQQQGQGGYAPQAWHQGTRHASNESVSVNNPALVDGRHSPDAFANLSSRY